MISIGDDTVPPLWGATLRLALAAVALAVIARARGLRRPHGAALRTAATYGCLNFGVSFALLYWAETRAPSGLAAVMYATIPLSATVFTRAFGLERLTALKLGAAGIALLGVGVIFAAQHQGALSVRPFVALLVAAVVASLGTVLLKRGPRQSPIVVNAVATVCGCAVCLGASFALGEPHLLPRTFPQIGPILYLTLAGSIGAFVLLAWLVNHWDVTRISFVSVIVPIVALVLGALVRHERIGLASLTGSALVTAGVLLRIRADRAPAHG